MVADSYNVLFLDSTTAVTVHNNVFLRDTPPQVGAVALSAAECVTVEIGSVAPPLSAALHRWDNGYHHGVARCHLQPHRQRNLVARGVQLKRRGGCVPRTDALLTAKESTLLPRYPGPDGCAIDFETSAVGTVVSGNYISHSWGAGIMVFGHTVCA
jgi:hypothetical protein